MIGGLDFYGYGRVRSLNNALKIPDGNVLDYTEKEQAILKILKNGPQEKVKVLLYKDRPYYADANLWVRPFLTALNYFRTLNFPHVLSWARGLLLFQCMANRAAKIAVLRHDLLLFLSVTTAVFLMGFRLSLLFSEESCSGLQRGLYRIQQPIGPYWAGAVVVCPGLGLLPGFKKQNDL